MTEVKNKKLSRRDAIKLLGAAAGAAALANIPSKWSKPEVISGVLPVHAQSTCGPLAFLGADVTNFVGQNGNYINNNVTVDPPQSGVSVQLSVGLSGGSNAPVPNPAGTYVTNIVGTAIAPDFAYSFGVDGIITLTWSFVNASDGCDTKVIQLSYT